MNIKLAEKVFAPDRVYVGKYTRTLNVEANGYLLDGKIDYENNPAHKLKLLEWIAKQLQPKNNLLMKANVRRAKKEATLEAIATGDTEKLLEIAESMLDENN